MGYGGCLCWKLLVAISTRQPAGFYYTVVTNSYCNVQNGQVQPGALKPGQIKVTQAEYEAFVIAHLTELWTNYGPLAEGMPCNATHGRLKKH